MCVRICVVLVVVATIVIFGHDYAFYSLFKTHTYTRRYLCCYTLAHALTLQIIILSSILKFFFSFLFYSFTHLLQLFSVFFYFFYYCILQGVEATYFQIEGFEVKKCRIFYSFFFFCFHFVFLLIKKKNKLCQQKSVIFSLVVFFHHFCLFFYVNFLLRIKKRKQT